MSKTICSVAAGASGALGDSDEKLIGGSSILYSTDVFGGAGAAGAGFGAAAFGCASFAWARTLYSMSGSAAGGSSGAGAASDLDGGCGVTTSGSGGDSARFADMPACG